MVEQFDKAKRYALIRKIHRKLQREQAQKVRSRRRVQKVMDDYDDREISRYDDRSGMYWSDEKNYISTHYKDSISVNKNRGNFDDGY